MSLLQPLKDALLRFGPGHPLTQSALRITLSQRGFRVTFRADSISLTRNHQTILIRPQDLSFVPLMADVHPHFFEMLQSERCGDEERLDFTGPHMHKYLRSGLEVLAPSIAEDDSMPDYTRRFRPHAGMTVFDVGAHAGLTTIELSQMVGNSGMVYAFEPDREARRFLLENLERYNANNVTILDTALGERSGEAMFSMDGTQAAGLVESLVYPTFAKVEKVLVTTLEDVCRQIGTVPDYIKADIEGGELGMVRGSLGFLEMNPIHMAFETHRLRDGSFTHDHLKPLLSSVGYQVEYLTGGATPQSFFYATPV